MTDPHDPATPASWEDQPIFRELFLVHGPPRLAAMLREGACVLFESLLEGGPPADDPSLDEPWVHVRVRALARDLRFTGRVLGSLAEEPTQASLEPEEVALAMRCADWAREVAELAATLEASAGPKPGSRRRDELGTEPGKEEP